MDDLTVAERYTLVVELGRGAMGVVWRAHDRLLNRPVALKELHVPAGLTEDERRVLEERVLREARTAGRLNHPGVVTVHDVIIEQGKTYLAMELVDAASLGMLIERHGPIDEAWVANIALQTLDALEAAHAAGTVHRDVKPGNIMVAPDGRVKLADFGIAQAKDDPRLTTNGGLIGSPAYLSPDRLAGADASPASDLWALGVTMAHAVEGVSPFERTSTAATLRAIMNEPPKLTRSSPRLTEVIRGLLAVNPDDRLTAPQARAMLTGGAKPKTRRRTKRVLATALGVLAIGAAGFTAYGGTTPPTTTTQIEPVPATFGRGGQVPGWNLSGTQCAQGFLATGRPVLAEVPCDGPHDIQLFAAATPLWDKPKSTSYPGEQWLTDYAQNYCGEQFARLHEPGLTFATLVPTEQEWNAWQDQSAPGRQEVLCVTWKQDRSTLDRTVSP